MNEDTDLTRLERAMWLKPPHEIRPNGWFYRTFPVLFALLVFLSVRTSVSQGFGVSALQDASTAILIAIGTLCIVAEGLYAGVYFGRRSAVLESVGRRLRLWLTFLILAFFPFYIAAHISAFGVGWGYGTGFWAFAGGVIGGLVVLALILHIRHRYKRFGEVVSRI